jgi:rare lipoprotein A
MNIYIIFLLTVLILNGCANTPKTTDINQESDSEKSKQFMSELPKSRYGNPENYCVLGKCYNTLKTAANYKEKGIASWYGPNFHGRLTSTRETYDMYGMTAAHKTLPLPTYVLVTNLHNKKSIVVRVNDRGPFHDGRIIDLSYTAAARLDILRTGTGLVEVTALDYRDPLVKLMLANVTSPQSKSQTITE